MKNLDNLYAPAKGQALPIKIITSPYTRFEVSIQSLPAERYKVVLMLIPQGGADGDPVCQAADCDTLAQAQALFKKSMDICIASIASALEKVGDAGEEWDVQIADGVAA